MVKPTMLLLGELVILGGKKRLVEQEIELISNADEDALLLDKYESLLSQIRKLKRIIMECN